ncbi:MAG: phosphate signaling complex protein PhoU [candidate division Zixibacteria bacterium]|jgi:phosphate transport system protein|nr:phosphate signaling complex protein PhoU [candidate division Zixibacteria bacterium]
MIVHRHFDEELDLLKQKLVFMASLAESMIYKAIKSLIEREDSLIQEVNKDEEKVNLLQIEIDELCLRLLALKQPMATDLRFITSAMKINSELERIADMAVNITQRAAVLIKQPQLKPYIDIPRMADLAQNMVKDSLDSFIKQDVDLARSVLIRDDKIDALKDQIFRELLTFMISDNSSIPRALELILVSRHLERIGDHATNIAEDVIYLVQGKDIRHHIEELGDRRK